MLKSYVINGKEWQFEEGEQPADAVELAEKAQAEPETKPDKPANKARKVATK